MRALPFLIILFAIVLFPLFLFSQRDDFRPAPQQNSDQLDASAQARSTYVLGPDDQIIIRALEAEEISEKPVRIDSRGMIRMPLIGQIHAAGLNLDELEAIVRTRLEKYYKNPQVGVSLVEYHSQPVSVMGAVRTPGVQQLQGQKSLMETLSSAGGLLPEAGYVVKITRR